MKIPFEDGRRYACDDVVVFVDSYRLFFLLPHPCHRAPCNRNKSNAKGGEKRRRGRTKKKLTEIKE